MYHFERFFAHGRADHGIRAIVTPLKNHANNKIVVDQKAKKSLSGPHAPGGPPEIPLVFSHKARTLVRVVFRQHSLPRPGTLLPSTGAYIYSTTYTHMQAHVCTSPCTERPLRVSDRISLELVLVLIPVWILVIYQTLGTSAASFACLLSHFGCALLHELSNGRPQTRHIKPLLPVLGCNRGIGDGRPRITDGK